MLESVFLNLIINDVNCLVGCIYRPPSSDIQLFLVKLTELLEVIRTNYPRHILIISGDFNLIILNCYTSVPFSNFVSLMYSNNLNPTILRPTRVGKTSATLIDHIWTTSSFGNSFNLCESGVILSNITDHYSIFNVFSVGGIVTDERYVEIEKRVITDESKEFLSNRINSWDWECLKNLRSVNEVYDTFIDQFKKLYDENCPVKAVRVKKLDVLKPYITREIKASDIYRGRPCYIIFSRKLKFFRTVGFAQAFA